MKNKFQRKQVIKENKILYTSLLVFSSFSKACDSSFLFMSHCLVYFHFLLVSQMFLQSKLQQQLLIPIYVKSSEEEAMSAAYTAANIWQIFRRGHVRSIQSLSKTEVGQMQPAELSVDLFLDWPEWELRRIWQECVWGPLLIVISYRVRSYHPLSLHYLLSILVKT